MGFPMAMPGTKTLRRISNRVSKFGEVISHAKAERIRFASGTGDASYLLYGIAKALKPEICVEIGSARGRSACYIGMALKENGLGRLYAIDPHTVTDWNDSESVNSFETMKRNLDIVGVSDRVEILRDRSEVVATGWSREIDMIFIDGDHTYEGVRRDWELFAPHIREFGVAVFHDTLWELAERTKYTRSDMGVPRFVDELRMQGYPVITIDRDCGTSIVQPKVGGVPLRQSAVSAKVPMT
jgi:predicted O-methyltransferase YrrM